MPRSRVPSRPSRFRHARRPSPGHALAVVGALAAAVYLAGLAAVVVVTRPDTGSAAAPAPSGSAAARSGSAAPAPGGSVAGDPARADGTSRTTRARTAQPVITYPERGGGTWTVAAGGGGVAGTAGRLLRYRVAVEAGIGNVDVAAFAAQVTSTLADPRSWTGTGEVRLQRVGRQERADFVVHLATPATRDELCRSGPDRYTSCRSGDRVVLNVARWVHGAAAVGGDLQTYRQYVVNHEVGHRLGHGHERCPGPGLPAPVMQQQTLGLHGCRPQAWPQVDGREYHGPAGAYDDPIPPDPAR
jgi:hypothetical protein